VHHITISTTTDGFHATPNDVARTQQHCSRGLFEANLDAFVVTDTHGIITDANQQMVDITRRSRAELLGSNWFYFCPDAVAASVAFGQALTEDRVSAVDLVVKSCNGPETLVSYNAAPIYDDRANIIGVFATLRDATELARLRQELDTKTREVERADQMKAEFLATMSHELRTPLTAILGFSEALLFGLLGNMSDGQKEYIQDIHNSGRHLLDMITDILDLAKIDAGFMALRLEEANFTDILSYSLQHNFDQLDAARIDMVIEDGGKPIVAQLDLGKTQKLISHMLSNAAKFSAPNGNVHIHACRVLRNAVGQISFKGAMFGPALPPGDCAEFIQLSVTDTGIGIAEESLPKVYNRFTQVESGLDRRFDGAGIGISMVQHLAELHGGTTAIASQLGAGTCFTVWLPIYPAVGSPDYPINGPH
jgi:PAS domain S-box-containing protein